MGIKLKTNFNEEVLLLGLDIKFETSLGQQIIINIPKIKDIIGDDNLGRFLQIISIDLNKIKEENVSLGFDAETLQGVFIGSKMYGYDQEVIEEGLRFILPGTSYTKAGIAVDDQVLLEQDLQLIKNIILVGTGKMSMEDYTTQEKRLGETEIDRLTRENEERIAKIKKSANDSKGKEITFAEGMITIISMLPGISLENIRELNMFSYKWLLKYAERMAADRIHVVAAGFGNLKDYKFITDK